VYIGDFYCFPIDTDKRPTIGVCGTAGLHVTRLTDMFDWGYIALSSEQEQATLSIPEQGSHFLEFRESEISVLTGMSGNFAFW